MPRWPLQCRLLWDNGDLVAMGPRSLEEKTKPTVFMVSADSVYRYVCDVLSGFTNYGNNRIHVQQLQVYVLHLH